MHFNFAARAARYSVETRQLARRRPDQHPAAGRGPAAPAGRRDRADRGRRRRARGGARTDLGIPRGRRGGDAPAAARASCRSTSTAGRVPRSATSSSWAHRILHLAGRRTRRTRSSASAAGGGTDGNRLEVVEPLHGDWSAASGFELGDRLESSRASAIFVSNDHMAIGLLSALRERSLRVPEDVSVVGFDDVRRPATSSPAHHGAAGSRPALGGSSCRRCSSRSRSW